MIVLGEYDDRLLESRPLLRSDADDTFLDRIVIGNEGAEVFTPTDGNYLSQTRARILVVLISLLSILIFSPR